jgi:hypothetical protein
VIKISWTLMLKKKSNSVCCHVVCKSVAMGESQTANISMLDNPADIYTKIIHSQWNELAEITCLVGLILYDLNDCSSWWFYLMHIMQNHLSYVRVYNPNPLCRPPRILNDKLWQMDRCYMSLGFFQLPKWGYYSNNIGIIRVLDTHTYSI